MLPPHPERYRAGLLSTDVNERRAISRALAQLAATQHANFMQLCHRLLDDPELRVRSEILWHIMRFAHRDDAITGAKVRAALPVPPLRPRALLALGTVGTPSAYPLLYTSAVAGEGGALQALARQTRTEAQRHHALRLSRAWLLSEHYHQREEALMALRILSTAQAEEDLLLRAYVQYGDDLLVWALGGASARMLPVLRALLTRWPAGSAEYGDVMKAIRRLQTRLAHGERADPAVAEGRPYLGDFLYNPYEPKIKGGSRDARQRQILRGHRSLARAGLRVLLNDSRRPPLCGAHAACVITLAMRPIFAPSSGCSRQQARRGASSYGTLRHHPEFL